MHIARPYRFSIGYAAIYAQLAFTYTFLHPPKLIPHSTFALQFMHAYYIEQYTKKCEKILIIQNSANNRLMNTPPNLL